MGITAPDSTDDRGGEADDPVGNPGSAEQIALWVRQAVSRPIPVRKLNIGHHAHTGQAGNTSDQRRVVIILVLDRDERTNLDQALRSAMAQESVRAPIFEALLTKYSLGTAPTFTWVD